MPQYKFFASFFVVSENGTHGFGNLEVITDTNELTYPLMQRFTELFNERNNTENAILVNVIRLDG